MKKIYLHNIIEGYPFRDMDKSIVMVQKLQWNTLIPNSNGVLAKNKIDLDNLPNQLTISDYKQSENRIDTIILKKEDNIKDQLDKADTDYRIKTEFHIVSTYHNNGKRASDVLFINQKQNYKTEYNYDVNDKLESEIRYSPNNQVITDKTLYEYDEYSNLVKISVYNDNSSGGGPNFLSKQREYKYNSNSDLISANENCRYSLKKQSNGYYLLIIEDINSVTTKMYNEKKDIIWVKYNDELISEFKRKYNLKGDEIKLETYSNNELQYIVKTKVGRKSYS